jgi:hypothetical protein
LFRRETALVTLFSLHSFDGHQPGTCFFLDEESAYSKIDNAVLEVIVHEDALSILKAGASSIKDTASLS